MITNIVVKDAGARGKGVFALKNFTRMSLSIADGMAEWS
jgi:hypothetical protein